MRGTSRGCRLAEIAISTLAVGAFNLALNPKLGIETFPKFIEYAKAHPNEVKIGVGGNPSINDLNRILLEQAFPGLKISSVPYKDEAQAIVDAMAGHITGVIGSMSQIGAVSKEGKLTAVVTLGEERREPLETVPAIGEFAPGFRAFLPSTSFWGPAGMPKSVVERLQSAIATALTDKEVMAKARFNGTTVRPSTSDELRNGAVLEVQRLREALKKLNFNPE